MTFLLSLKSFGTPPTPPCSRRTLSKTHLKSLGGSNRWSRVHLLTMGYTQSVTEFTGLSLSTTSLVLDYNWLWRPADILNTIDVCVIVSHFCDLSQEMGLGGGWVWPVWARASMGGPRTGSWWSGNTPSDWSTLVILSSYWSGTSPSSSRAGRTEVSLDNLRDYVHLKTK